MYICIYESLFDAYMCYLYMYAIVIDKSLFVIIMYDYILYIYNW